MLLCASENILGSVENSKIHDKGYTYIICKLYFFYNSQIL